MKRTQSFWRSSFWRDETGAAAALYALALPALVAVAGIAFDYARVAALDTELQNAADQAALAAATQLDRRAGAVGRSAMAATSLINNETRFANDGEGRNVSDLTVRVYADKDQAETCGEAGALSATATGDAQAAFVCVQVNTRTANFALTPVVGALRSNISAQAVAGVGSALCRTPPLMVCNPSEASDPDANFILGMRGRGMLVVQGGGGAWTPGNFGYLDTGTGNGATGVRMALGWVSPPGNCISQNGVDTVDTEPGNMSNVPQALNTRFDIYDNQGCEDPGSCPPSINTRKDLVRQKDASGNNSCRLHKSQGWYLPDNLYDPVNPDFTPDAMGHPRDVCHALATGRAGACTTAIGDGDWHRDTYFRTNYLRTEGPMAGTRWNSADWQANTKLKPDATRYEVYLWEIANRGNVIDGVRILDPRPRPETVASGTPINHAGPVCSQLQPNGGYGNGITPSATSADRRRMSVAVVNCTANNVRGNTTGVPVRRWMDVFLVEPSLARPGSTNRRPTDQDQIYVEIIGETTSGSAGETAGSVIRRDVPYLIR
jgi:Flp pilus assembly protein TadG